jgi:hypothetical protein
MDSSVILFLNKVDLFLEKIGSSYRQNPLKVPLSACFSHCPIHQNPYKDGLKYIKDQFATRLGNRVKSDFYVHVTRATDKGNIDLAFGNVHDQLRQLIIFNAVQKAVLL